jgi:di/tricarboxylate transporter
VNAQHANEPSKGGRPIIKIVAALIVGAGAILLVIPPFADLGVGPTRALGLVLIAVGFWGTDTLPPHVASLLFFLLAVVLGVSAPAVVFSGFHAGAVWLIFGGMVLGLAIQRTGLGARMAEAVLRRVGHSHNRIIFGIAIASFALAFVMPSAMSRVVLLVPIVTALAERLGYAPGSAGRDGMVLIAAFATVMAPMGLLPATVPNVVMAGLIESIYGVTLQYGRFLVLNLTVAGPLTFIASTLLVMAMFRDTPGNGLEGGESKPFTAAEWRLGAILAITLALWGTDSLHGVAPAWVAMGAAVICLLPVTRLVPAKALSESVNYGPWFFTAGIIGVGAVVADTGLAKHLGAWFIDLSGLAPGQDAYNFFAILGMGSLLSLAANPAGTAAVLTPLAPDIARATGWPMETAMLAQVASFMVVILPYQLAPILTAVLLGGVRYGRAVRMCLAYSAIYLLLIAPLYFLWWRWLGMFNAAP